MTIYVATVRAATGDILVAVETSAKDAKADILTAAQALTREHYGMLRVGEHKRAGRAILADMAPIKPCRHTGQDGITRPWAWGKRA